MQNFTKGNRKKSKKFFLSQNLLSTKKYLIISVLILIFGGYSMIIFLKSDFLRIKTDSPIQIKNLDFKKIRQSNRRIEFDFDEIKSGKFNNFEDNILGISLRYPEAMIFKDLTELYKSDPSSKIYKYISFELTPVPWAVGTEFHDGLRFEIIAKKDFSIDVVSDLLNKAPYVQKNYSQINTIEKFLIDGREVAKTTECCYIGTVTQYHILSMNANYYIVLSFFPVGPQKDEFEELGKMIISSVRFLDTDK